MAEAAWRRWSVLEGRSGPKGCWGGKCVDQGTEEEEDGLDGHRGQNGEGKVVRGIRGSPDALRAAGGWRVEE